VTAERFDVVIVGAGPAGSAAALTLAKEGVSVAVLERGETPGAKNVFGGVVYKWPLSELFPNFAEVAPIERRIVDTRLIILNRNSSLTLSYKEQAFAESSEAGFTALRTKFDSWLAQKAEEAGAVVITGMPVTDVIQENGRVVGLKTGEGRENEVYASAVVAADGVMSTVLSKSGIRGTPPPEQVALGIKEMIELPADMIEARFNLKKGQGARLEFIGNVVNGKSGGGFVYTNGNTLSVGIAILLSELMELKQKPYELLDAFKAHPSVAPLIEGGKPKEYQAHLIPEGGYPSIPRLVDKGVLAVGDAAMLCLYPEGTNMALASGILAGRALARAKKADDFSSNMLEHYRLLMEQSYVLEEHRRKSNFNRIMREGGRFFEDYPELLSAIARELLVVDGVTKRLKHEKARKMIREKVGYLRLARDLYSDIWQVLPW
jgi:electron transfer flavoprotein-quinone oxidoreductase